LTADDVSKGIKAYDSDKGHKQPGRVVKALDAMGDEPSGVSFVNPPLGGTWTQEHLASAIKEIEKQPRFALSVKDLSAADPSLVCEAYTDPQPKKGEK